MENLPEGEGLRRDDHPTDPSSISPSTDLKVGGSVRVMGCGRGRGQGRGRGRIAHRECFAQRPRTVSPMASSVRLTLTRSAVQEINCALDQLLRDCTQNMTVGHQTSQPIDPPSTSIPTHPPTDSPTSSPPTDPPTSSLPTNLPATPPPTNPPTTLPPTNLPTTPPPSVSGPQPPPPFAEALVLTMSDLGTLMRLLHDAAHCASKLGVFLDLGPDLIRSLKDKALGDPFDHLNLVLETRLKHTNPPLFLKDLVEAISLPPISNEVLAMKLQKFFMSEERQKRLEGTSISPLSSAMAIYSQFLDDIYQIAAIPPDPKGVPEPSTKYTNLAVIKKEKVTQAEADTFTKSTFHGGIDQIMHEKKAIELKDIFKPEGGQTKVDFVLAEGVPGVGKSTMAHELCRKQHEIEVTKAFAAVVLLRLREKEVQEVKSVADLLYHDHPKVKEAVVDEICATSGENILFILDGFDEVPHKIRKNMFVANIIRGQCLPKATVLVTSRPSARADLLALRKPDKHIEVLGFTHEQIEQYASSIFSSSTPVLADFLKYISTNPAIKSMMYVPLNCAIVVEIYQENREEGRPIPQTMTQLYSELTLTLMRRHYGDIGSELESFPITLEDLGEEHPKCHAQLLILAELAFNGTLKQEVIFEKLPAGCSTLGLMTASQQLYVTRRGSSKYSFFHLSLQEFLSAYYISQLPDNEQKKAFEDYSDECDSKVKKFSHMDVTLPVCKQIPVLVQLLYLCMDPTLHRCTPCGVLQGKCTVVLLYPHLPNIVCTVGLRFSWPLYKQSRFDCSKINQKKGGDPSI